MQRAIVAEANRRRRYIEFIGQMIAADFRQSLSRGIFAYFGERVETQKSRGFRNVPAGNHAMLLHKQLRNKGITAFFLLLVAFPMSHETGCDFQTNESAPRTSPHWKRQVQSLLWRQKDLSNTSGLKRSLNTFRERRVPSPAGLKWALSRGSVSLPVAAIQRTLYCSTCSL